MRPPVFLGSLTVRDPVLALILCLSILFFLASLFLSRRKPPALLPCEKATHIPVLLDAALESGTPITIVAGGSGEYGIGESCATLAIWRGMEKHVNRLSLPNQLISSMTSVILPAIAGNTPDQSLPSAPALEPVLYAGPEPFLLAAAFSLQERPKRGSYLAVSGPLPVEGALLVMAPEHTVPEICSTSQPLSGLLASQRVDNLIVGERFYACSAYLGDAAGTRSLRAHDLIRWGILLAVLAGSALMLLGVRGGGL